LYTLLNLPFVQQKIAAIAAKELQNKLGTEVKIGNAKFDLFSRITLENVYVADQKNDTLLSAARVSAGLDILPLFKNRFVFSSVQLFGFHAHLSKDSTNAEHNFQFAIDAFKKKDEKPSQIDLRFGSIHIRRGHITYDVFSEPETPNKFNAKHIEVSKLLGTITVKTITNDSLNINLRKLSLEEKSGFVLDKMSFKAVANKKKAIISGLTIKLPKTDLKFDNLFADYDLTDDAVSFVDNLHLNVKINPSPVILQDFSGFIPAFRQFSEKMTVSGQINGFLNNLSMDYLNVEYDNNMILQANMKIKNILHNEEAFLSGKISELRLSAQTITDIANNFSKDEIRMPEMIRNLGTIRFRGDISGYLNNLVANGHFFTALGNISTDLEIGYRENLRTFKGAVETDDFNLGGLLEKNKDEVGNISLKVMVDGRMGKNEKAPSGLVKGIISGISLKGYDYRNIEMDGRFSISGFNGKISLNDPNGKINIAGLMDLSKKLPVFDLNITAEHVKPGGLNLSNKYKNSDLSFTLSSNFSGNHIDNGQGTIRINDLRFSNNEKILEMSKITLDISGENSHRTLSVKSDVITGNITGAYEFKTLLSDFYQIASQYIPTFIDPEKYKEKRQANDFTAQFVFGNTQNIAEVLDIPVPIINQASLSAKYNGKIGKFRAEALIPRANYNNFVIESGRLTFENPGNEMKARVHFKNLNVKKETFVEVNIAATARNDSIFANIGFNNNDSSKYSKGQLSASAKFNRDSNDKLMTSIQIHPSNIILSNAAFAVTPSSIEIAPERIVVNRFGLEGKENDYVKISGVYSDAVTDTLHLELLNTKLDYIGLITNNYDVLNFGGNATGHFHIMSKGKGMPVMNGDVKVRNFSYNEAVLGDLTAFSEWNENNQGILLSGKITQPDHKPTGVHGHIFPTKDSLDLTFNANHLNLKLIDPYVKKVVRNFSGRGYGDVRLYGHFKRVNLVGKAYVQNAQFGIGFLNTDYSLSDTVYMTTKSISVRNAKVFDSQKHTGFINATLNHQYFKDFIYNVNVTEANNVMVFNATQNQNPMFFGTVYGSGTARLSGTLDKLDVFVNMRSEAESKLTFSFFERASAANHNFITFVDKRTSDAKETSKKKAPPKKTNSKFEMNVILRVEATPDATVQLIMDPRSGDKLTGRGSGDLRLTYNDRTDDLTLAGRYIIEEGHYSFSWEDVIRKDFIIKKGGSVVFDGDPYNALLNIEAVHSLYANISSLGEGLGEDAGRQKVPVDAVINITGSIKQPDIQSSIELPSSGEDVRRKVAGLIHSQDDVNRQLFYLLLFGTFDPLESVTVPNPGSAQLASVVSSTLTSQLNTILKQLSDKVSIQTNVYSGNISGIPSMEAGVLISMPIFNDRLILKSNVGYRDNIYTTTNFIGDFDAEYKLTKSGEIRLKGYSHYNENSIYYGRTGLTTQGLGIMFTKDFNLFPELFGKKAATEQQTTVQSDTIKIDN